MENTQTPAQSVTEPQLAALRAEHLDAVTEINRGIQSHPWNLHHWQSCQLPSYRNWVLLNPEPIGYASFLLAADTAELMNIGVSPDHQSKGLGRGILCAGISLLPEQVHTLYLEVRKSNKVARRLYESLGFRMLAKRANYYPVDDEQREPAMVYSLENDGLPIKDIDFYQESGKLKVVQR
jgi:[ribosomal protein S18]-alanine N-acetyltransferase